jgi:hypothetical protein
VGEGNQERCNDGAWGQISEQGGTWCKTEKTQESPAKTDTAKEKRLKKKRTPHNPKTRHKRKQMQGGKQKQDN